MNRKGLISLSFTILMLFSMSTALPLEVSAYTYPLLRTEPQERLNMTVPSGPFTMDIYIENIEGCGAWALTLKWNPDVLNCTGAVEGPFLMDVNETLWVPPRIEAGYVDMACSLTGWETLNVTGSGVLATVTLQVVGYGKGDVPSKGLYGAWLNFADVEFRNSTKGLIPVDIKPGVVTTEPAQLQFPWIWILIIIIPLVAAVVYFKFKKKRARKKKRHRTKK